MKEVSFRTEWRECLAFIRHPSLARQLPHAPPISGWMADWLPAMRWQRLLAWAATLWLINIFALGPIVLTVFEMSGATHRINVHQLPWFQAIIWAPVVEELLFRFGLRRPFQAVWMMPLMVLVLLNGLAWWSSCLLVATIALCLWSNIRSTGPGQWSWKWLRRYRVVFPYVFHIVAITFAAVHIRNFIYIDLEWWMMVVFVTPQWVTGLVLGWMRVRRGVATSMLLHALFNAGPLCLAWTALQFTQ
jgi:hypothetical protein